jgi:RNA polymerase sigma-70 factor (ECF subfamily)
VAPHDSPRDARTDEDLVAALRRGDAAAFDVLYLRHRDWVVRMARRLTCDDADALDVLQETFLYLLRKLPQLELRARLSTLLFPVVRNLALARRRRRAAAPEAVEPAVEDPPLLPPEELAAALAALPEQQRQAVLLRFVDGLALAEIAARTGVPLGTVKSRLHQALATLRADPAARRYFLG